MLLLRKIGFVAWYASLLFFASKTFSVSTTLIGSGFILTAITTPKGPLQTVFSCIGCVFLWMTAASISFRKLTLNNMTDVPPLAQFYRETFGTPPVEDKTFTPAETQTDTIPYGCHVTTENWGDLNVVTGETIYFDGDEQNTEHQFSRSIVEPRTTHARIYLDAAPDNRIAVSDICSEDSMCRWYASQEDDQEPNVIQAFMIRETGKLHISWNRPPGPGHIVLYYAYKEKCE